MATPTTTGATTTIPDHLARLLDAIAVREGFTANAYTLTAGSGSNHGDNFMGVMLRVHITGERRVDGVRTADARLSLICKVPPAERARREMFETKTTFEREIYVYETVLPLFAEFQMQKGCVTPADGFFQFPKCYGSVANAENDAEYALVLADLRADGYEMFDRFETLDVEHARLALGELGKLHALSFVLRDQRPDVLRKLQQLKAETMLKMADTEMAKPFWENNYAMAADTLREDETVLRGKIDTIKHTFLERMRACSAYGAAEPFAVLNHGDFWNNNMMYRYAAGSKRPLALCIIDWQMTQFGSSALDIGYFVFSSMGHELRGAHFWDLMRAYHGALANTVRALGSDPERLFRFDDLRAQLHEFVQYGLVMAPMLVQVVTAMPEELPDLDEMARQVQTDTVQTVEGMVGKDNVRYRERMSGVIRDYFALGFDI